VSTFPQAPSRDPLPTWAVETSYRQCSWLLLFVSYRQTLTGRRNSPVGVSVGKCAGVYGR
jgi:hypothetical protein